MENRFLKKRKLIRNKKGQGMIETSLAMVIVLLLFGGMFKIWMWGNRQIVERQVRYNATRITAGTSADNYKSVWGPEVYTPPELTEDDVLLGER